MTDLRELTRLARTYRAYIARSGFCNYPPTRIWVEASSDCNLRCSFCGNRKLEAKERGFMDTDMYRRLADEVAGKVSQLNVFHRGESLLHPGIADMVGYASALGLRTRIHTNGTVLTPHLARELIHAGLDVLSISFDGYNREMYEANRPGARYDQVLANILTLLSTKKAMHADKPFVAIELMEISDRSPRELRQDRQDFLSQFKGLPLDKFIIRRPHNWAGLIEAPGSDVRQKRTEKKVACPFLWHALVVFWDGRVVPCPQDFFGVLAVGNLQADRLLDVWNGEELRALRRDMANPCALDRKPCVDCDRILRKTIAGIPTDYLGRFLSDTLLKRSRLRKLLPH